MNKNEKRTYRGVDYFYDIISTGEYSVTLDGNDFFFNTEKEVKEAIKYSQLFQNTRKVREGINDFVINKKVSLNIGQYAALIIDGKFTVQIKKESEGYVVDVLAEDDRDDVLGSMTVWNEDLED